MSLTSYRIGASVGGLVNVDTLVGAFAPRSIFKLYPVSYVRGDSGQVGDGAPVVTWHFDALTQAQVNALRAYLYVGSTYLLSSPVYITTKLDDGTFSTFSAVMHWPDDPDSKKVPAGAGVFQDFELTFTNMVRQ